jgi:tetratricopeptide (TPR) repeat protein
VSYSRELRPSDSAAAGSPPAAASNRIGWPILLVGVIGAAAVVLVAWKLAKSRVPQSLADIERLIDRGALPRAEQQARRYIERHASDSAGLLLLGRILGARESYSECAQVLLQVPVESPDRSMALLRAGQAWTMAHRVRDAEQAWRASIELGNDSSPQDPAIRQECRRQLCRLYALERRRDALWQMSWAMYADVPPRLKHEPLGMLARYDFELVDPLTAAPSLESAVDTDPTDFYSRRALGLYLLEAERTEQARAHLYRCVQDARENPVVWEAWLGCLYKTGDSFGLKKALDELPTSADSSTECWKYRGLLAEQQGDIPGAIAATKRCLQDRPWESEFHYRLGQLLRRVGDSKAAQDSIVRSQELQAAQSQLRDAFDNYKHDWAGETRRRPELAMQLAAAYEQSGRLKDALAWLRIALAEDPGHLPSIAAIERIESLDRSVERPTPTPGPAP